MNGLHFAICAQCLRRIDDVNKCWDLGNGVYLCSDACLVDGLHEREPWWSRLDSQQKWSRLDSQQKKEVK